MNIWLYVIISLLLFILIFLILKIILMKKSLKQIRLKLNKILKSDTNNLLTVDTTDYDIRKLANDLNIELLSLRNQRLQYENGNSQLKKSITNISHDIRTPLTAISGYIDLIKESNDAINQKQYLEIVERKTNDLITLTEQLFNYSKTIDVLHNIKKEMCCINDLLEECLANFYISFKENNIIPKIEICSKKIYKNIDRDSIIRVFENVLSNAVKYSNGDFKVELNDNGKITFSNRANSLDSITVDKIFDRYYTVENAKKSTGLGLSIAKQLVELNGGKMEGKFIKGNLIIEIEI